MLKIFVGPVMGGFEPPPTPPSIRHCMASICYVLWGRMALQEAGGGGGESKFKFEIFLPPWNKVQMVSAVLIF
jgi:hypothetical protein